MLELRDIRVQYGDRVLFKDISFLIKPVDKIALIGRNGVGKSTLFKIIDGEISPDQGKVQAQNGISIGHLEQTINLPQDISIKAAAQLAFQQLILLEEEHEQLQRELEERTDYESEAYMELLDRFNLNLERIQHHDVDNRDKQTELILKGLGFDPDVFDHPVNTLSGGWQMRVQLARLLLERPDLLLLDEPTNHLDIEAIIWLERFIQEYDSAVMVISHDRAFLRQTANRVIEIENSKLLDLNVSYERFLQQKTLIREQQEAAFRNQQKDIAEKERTIQRFMAKATKTSMAQSMQKQLDKMERIELDNLSHREMRINFLPVPRSGRTVLKASGLAKSYGDKQVLKNLSFEIERGDRVAIVGQNGQGKTTLARLLLKKLDLSAGVIEHGSQLSIGYYAQNQSDLLDENATILEFMELRAPEGMRTRVRSVLGAFMFSGEDADKKIKVLSGGERARLAFAHLLMQPLNLLVLDEPTNHLDMDSKEVLKQALLDYDGTLLVVSHDRDFLAGLTDKTLELRDHKMHTYLGDVEYFLSKRAMDDMRDVALYKSEVSAEPEPVEQVPVLSREERKALQKKVTYAEREVLQLERKVKDFEIKMADPDFYNSSDHEDKTRNYQETKQALVDAEAKWEELVEQLGSLG